MKLRHYQYRLAFLFAAVLAANVCAIVAHSGRQKQSRSDTRLWFDWEEWPTLPFERQPCDILFTPDARSGLEHVTLRTSGHDDILISEGFSRGYRAGRDEHRPRAYRISPRFTLVLFQYGPDGSSAYRSINFKILDRRHAGRVVAAGERTLGCRVGPEGSFRGRFAIEFVHGRLAILQENGFVGRDERPSIFSIEHPLPAGGEDLYSIVSDWNKVTYLWNGNIFQLESARAWCKMPPRGGIPDVLRKLKWKANWLRDPNRSFHPGDDVIVDLPLDVARKRFPVMDEQP